MQNNYEIKTIEFYTINRYYLVVFIFLLGVWGGELRLSKTVDKCLSNNSSALKVKLLLAHIVFSWDMIKPIFLFDGHPRSLKI